VVYADKSLVYTLVVQHFYNPSALFHNSALKKFLDSKKVRVLGIPINRTRIMKLKYSAIIGLVFLIVNQIMLLGGNEFIQNQQPIDYAH